MYSVEQLTMAASYLEIDLASELDLVWIVLQSVVAPLPPYWQVCVNIFFSICRHIGRFVCVCVYTYLFIGGNASSGGTKFLLPNTDSQKSVYSGFMALCQY